MRDKSHAEQVDGWARQCRQDMRKCQRQVALLVNAQIENANNFYKRLARTPNGKQKIEQIRRISRKDFWH